jgi:hypothetical protein
MSRWRCVFRCSSASYAIVRLITVAAASAGPPLSSDKQRQAPSDSGSDPRGGTAAVNQAPRRPAGGGSPASRHAAQLLNAYRCCLHLLLRLLITMHLQT